MGPDCGVGGPVGGPLLVVCCWSLVPFQERAGWERCCLGQPTITFSIADNQVEIAEQLSKKNIAIYSNLSNLLEDFDQFFGTSGKELQRVLITNSLLICDGFGAPRVIEELEKKFENRNS